MLRHVLLSTVAFGLVLPAAASAQDPMKSSGMVIVEARTLVWNDLPIPGFAPGLKIAAMEGDPAQANQPYTLRLKFPDGYAFPAHYHPNAENLTVVSGTFLLGHGEKVNESALKTYAPGDYLFIPGKMPHFGRVQGETVVQLHGMGPFDVLLVDKAAASKN